MNDMADTVALTAAGAGITAIFGWLARHVIMQALSSKSAIITASAGDQLLTRLQDEIKRLEDIIARQRRDGEEALAKAKDERETEFKKLRDRIDELEQRLELVHDLELQDAADIAELTILLDSFCIGCDSVNGNSARNRIDSILSRMRERKAAVKAKGRIKVVLMEPEA